MTIESDVRAGWEHRFPALTGKWTHWRLRGDGEVLADVPGDNLLEALNLVEHFFGRYRSIKVSRAAANSQGICFEEEPRDHEISRYIYDAEE